MPKVVVCGVLLKFFAVKQTGDLPVLIFLGAKNLNENNLTNFRTDIHTLLCCDHIDLAQMV